MQVDLDPLAGKKGAEKSRRLAKYWLEQIGKVDAEQKNWIKRGIAIEKRYRDQRNRSEEEGQRRANYLWANTQIMYPALYGKCPLPIAERRFRDKDPIGRAAAQIIERSLRNDLELDDFHDSVGSAVLDYLLPGRGVCWVRYEPEIGESISIPVDTQNDLKDDQGDIEPDDDDPDEEKLEDTGSRLIRESAPVDYIHWRDFYIFPRKARRWSEVTAVGKLVYMSQDEMCERWGDEIGKAIPLQKEDRDKRDNTEGKATTDKNDDKGHVYEIWDKEKLEVVWVADGFEFIADRKDDPAGFTGFFPTPRPLSANSTNGTITPVPFFAQYQDQARQIDELTQRISQLAKACKIAGVYDAACTSLARLLDESVENELIPEDNWARFVEKAAGKGLAGSMSLLPLEEIVTALKELQQVKVATVEEMDRITGMTDVLRGVTTDARETLGKGRLNNNNGKSRLRQGQDEVARFCRDIVRLKAEVICKHFSNRSIIDSSGALYEEGLGIADVMHWGEGGGDELGSPAAPSGVPQQNSTMPSSAVPQQNTPPIPGQPPQPAGNVVPFPGGHPQLGGAPPGGVPGQPPQMQPPQPQSPYGPLSDEQKVLAAVTKIQSALKLLRDDLQRGFRIDIEVDSTIVGDEEADKEQRTAFVGAVTTFMKEAGPLAMQNPEITPLLGKLLQFAVRGFRVGRDLEQAIEEFCDEAEKKAKAMAAKGPPPNPEMLKVQGQMQIAQEKAKADMQGKQMDMQADQASARLEQQTEQMRAQAEQQNSAADIKMKEMEMQIEQMRAGIEQMKAEYEAQQAHMDHQHAVKEHHMAMSAPAGGSNAA